VAWKTYEYRIWNAPVSDPFLTDRAWHLPFPAPLDLERMETAAALLRGRHDFAAMASNAGYARTTTVRTVSRLELRRRGPLLTVRVTADGFLYHMVRNIVGALVQMGKGKLSIADFTGLLAARKRALAPASAPAFGLYLMKVAYFPRKIRLKRAKNRRPPPAFEE
jgi:tRNA pseudouridine38-40 synthase